MSGGRQLPTSEAIIHCWWISFLQGGALSGDLKPSITKSKLVCYNGVFLDRAPLALTVS